MKKASSAPTHEAIASRARRLWEEAGRPEGRDEEFWLRAERQLLSEMGKLPAAAPPSPRPAAEPPPVAPSPATAVPPVIRDVVQVRGHPPAPKRKRPAR